MWGTYCNNHTNIDLDTYKDPYSSAYEHQDAYCGHIGNSDPYADEYTQSDEYTYPHAHEC
jgi:hypothetical protein